jgi:D-alanyl-D-alanine carboxypeptidase (penicillin-binding protein 5/6)
MDSIREGTFGLSNTNRLVRFYQGATGLKTGSTAKAKFCVSATAKRNDMHLICVVMGAPSSDVRNSIATSLLNWGFANFEIYKNANEDLHPIKVCAGQSDSCNIYTDDFYLVVNKGEAVKIEKVYQIPYSVDAHIKKNQTVGKIQYLLNGKIVGESLVKSAENIEKIEFFDLFVRILSKFLIK